AVVVMALSALAGAHTFAWLGAHPATGFAVGVAVDAALCIALVGDQLLHRHGVSISWGRALRYGTALGSLALNSGMHAATGAWVSAGYHAIPSLLLIGLTEAAAAYRLAFARLAEQQRQAAALAAQRAADERSAELAAAQAEHDRAARRAQHHAERAAIAAGTTPPPAPAAATDDPDEARRAAEREKKRRQRAAARQQQPSNVVDMARPARAAGQGGT
ncbi:MAG: hypothetical protein ACRCZP_16390, partial [Phycicoccus sp.]